MRPSRIRILAASSVLILSGLVVSGNTRPSARTLYEQGQKAYLAGDYRAALERYTQAVEKNTSFLQARLALAETYAQLGEWDRARHSFQAALELDAKHLTALLGAARAALALGDRTAAMALLEQARSVDPGSDRVALMDGEYALSVGRADLAARHFARILRGNPGHAEALRGAATAASRLGRFDEAALHLRRARLVEPVNPAVHRIQGLVSLQQALELPEGTERDATLEAAHESLRTALILKPGDLDLEFRLLWLELHQGHSEAARERSRRLVSASADVRTHQYLPAYVLLGGGVDDVGRARQLTMRLLEATPDDSLIRFRLEEHVLGRKREFTASSSLRTYLARYHRQRFAHYDDRQLSDRRDFHMARTLELGNADGDLLQRKLELARLHGDFQVFVDVLQELVREQPQNMTLRFRLENALRRRSEDLEYGARQELGRLGREAAGVFVFDFKPEQPMPYHPDGGQMVAQALQRHVRYQGRIQATPRALRDRARDEAGLSVLERDTGVGLTFTPGRLTRIMGVPGIPAAVDFLIGGSYQSDAGGVRATYEVYEAATGRRIDRFRLEAAGRDAIHEISARGARRIAALAAARATVLAVRDDGLLVNAGARDGLSKGARLLVYRSDVREVAPVEADMRAKLLRLVGTPQYCTVSRVTERVALCQPEGMDHGAFHRGDRALLVPSTTARTP